jgi:hypothetical protein
MFFGEELQGVQKSTVAALCNCLRQIATFSGRHGTLQQVAMFCDSQTARTGTRRRVVEHKGIVERGGVFSLVTSARSVASAVGQIALGVRPMFDAGVAGQKNAGNSRDVLLTDRTKTGCTPNSGRTTVRQRRPREP